MSSHDEPVLELRQSDIEWLILADDAEVVNGKLYMIGGGWDRIMVQSLPWQQHMAIAVAIKVPWMDTNRQTPVEIELLDEDGSSLHKLQGNFVVGRPPDAIPGQALRTQIAIRMNAKFSKTGTYVVVCRLHGNGEPERFPFNVVASPQMAAGFQEQGDRGAA